MKTFPSINEQMDLIKLGTECFLTRNIRVLQKLPKKGIMFNYQMAMVTYF